MRRAKIPSYLCRFKGGVQSLGIYPDCIGPKGVRLAVSGDSSMSASRQMKQ